VKLESHVRRLRAESSTLSPLWHVLFESCNPLERIERPPTMGGMDAPMVEEHEGTRADVENAMAPEVVRRAIAALSPDRGCRAPVQCASRRQREGA
jgi:hypothetical protein